jgi:hypothetical protein
MKRRQHQRSHAAVRSVSLQLPVLLFMLPSIQCDNFHVRHRSAAAATAATTTIDATVVERCIPDSTYSALYRCSYSGDTADTRLTALCPAPLIDTKCRCAIAAISPLTGSFQQCSSCEIIEYMEEWSVTYDCSNLWQAEEPPEGGGGGKAADEEEEAIFAEAGGLDTTAATIPDTPSPTPSVRLVAQNSRTSPPYLFPTVRKLAVLPPPPRQEEEYSIASSQQSTTGKWMSYWQNILGG